MATDEREILKELLLEDYRYRAEALRNSEQAGESRINFFVGLVTLLGASLVTLSTETSGPKENSLIVIWLGVISVTLLLGVVIFARLLIRNKQTDDCKDDLDHIRQTFKDHFDDNGLLIGYTPVGGGAEGGARDFGGLSDIMMVINSILVGSLAACLVALLPISSVGWSNELLFGLAAGGGFFFAYGAQSSYADHRREAAKQKREARTQRFTHAGAVAYSLDPPHQLRYWLTAQSSFPYAPISAKGHFETALEAVEALTGQAARRVGLLGGVEKQPPDQGNKWTHIKYYLVELLGEPQPDKAKSLFYEDAQQEGSGLTLPDKQLLTLAHQRVKDKMVLHPISPPHDSSTPSTQPPAPSPQPPAPKT